MKAKKLTTEKWLRHFLSELVHKNKTLCEDSNHDNPFTNLNCVNFYHPVSQNRLYIFSPIEKNIDQFEQITRKFLNLDDDSSLLLPYVVNNKYYLFFLLRRKGKNTLFSINPHKHIPQQALQGIQRGSNRSEIIHFDFNTKCNKIDKNGAGQCLHLGLKILNFDENYDDLSKFYAHLQYNQQDIKQVKKTTFDSEFFTSGKYQYSTLRNHKKKIIAGVIISAVIGVAIAISLPFLLPALVPTAAIVGASVGSVVVFALVGFIAISIGYKIRDAISARAAIKRSPIHLKNAEQDDVKFPADEKGHTPSQLEKILLRNSFIKSIQRINALNGQKKEDESLDHKKIAELRTLFAEKLRRVPLEVFKVEFKDALKNQDDTLNKDFLHKEIKNSKIEHLYGLFEEEIPKKNTAEICSEIDETKPLLTHKQSSTNLIYTPSI